MSWLLLLLSCAVEPAPAPDPDPPDAAADLLPLEAPALLRRVSLDLRGVLPTAEELDAVEADPEALARLRDAWFDDPRFQERFPRLLAERWHTLVDVFDIEYVDYHLPIDQEYAFERAVGQEPLRLVSHLIARDRPWSEVVTADYTLANPLLLSIWPLEALEEGEGWVPARYTDGRPGLGVLSTNGFYWRYTTDESNMNRSRAAAVTRLMLCEDFLARPVSFSLDDVGADVTDPAEAVHTNPYCLACHAALDPIASSMFGFWWVVLYSDVEDTSYHPERENLGAIYLNTEPGYFGAPMSGLSELGYHVASDTRFYSCAVETFAELLWRREVAPSDREALEALRLDFLEGGARPRALMQALMDGPVYQAGALAEGADADTRARERVARMMSPSMVGSTLEDLTGFTWQATGFDQFDNDTFGYRLLAGGVDGYNVSQPQTQPGLTWALFYKRAAQAAAQVAVRDELVEGEPGGGLFEGVTLDTLPEDPAFTAQLDALHWRLFGRRAEADWLAAMADLWSRGADAGGPREAWTLVLTVMLRDPAFLTY